jgi:fused signal recognition particle receptor
MNIFKNLNIDRLKEGLSKTRDKFITRITESLSGKVEIDDKILDQIEEILVSADMSYDSVEKIIEDLKIKLATESNRSEENIIYIIKNSLFDLLKQSYSSQEYKPLIEQFKPYVILVVGVNGVGKTTTIGKLAYNFKQSGLKVIIGAADTFRAAANEQIDIWAERAGVQIIQRTKGSDPSSVAFETVSEAIKGNYDVVLIDTAGRLHNKNHLMQELDKIKRVIGKQLPNAPNDTFLVIDGSTGQNGVIQAEEFSKVANITGLIITKLDGTAKGGSVIQICTKLKIPIRYIGVGERKEDLQNFYPYIYIDALFDK